MPPAAWLRSASRWGLSSQAETLFREATIERFVLTGCRAVSAATRRTLRTNLRALARAHRAAPRPEPAPLPRERAKRPLRGGRDRGLPAPGRRAAHRGAADARHGADLPGGGGGPRRGRAAPRQRAATSSGARAGWWSGLGTPGAGGAGARPLPARPWRRPPASPGEGYLLGGREPGRRNLSAALRARCARTRPCRAWSRGGCGRPGFASARSRSACGPSWTRPGSAAPSGSATWWPSSRRWRRRRRSRCSEGPVETEAKLERSERIVDASGIAPRIEALLPVGVRPRQLSVRTLLLGMLSVAGEGRPAHLSRVHEALLALPEADQRRLGVIAEWKYGPHELTYRQVERTFGLLARALAKAEPDGEPCEALSEILDALLEASVEVCGEPETNSYAVDWTDLETFSVPPPKGGGRCADPEAAWGHRRGNSPGERDEVFYRLLPAGRHRRRGGARARGPRAGAPHPGRLLRRRPPGRARAGAGADGRGRDRDRRRPRRLRLRPPGGGDVGAAGPPPRRPPRPGPPPP